MGLSDRQKFLAGLGADEAESFMKLYDRAIRAEKTGGAFFGDFLSMNALSELKKRERYLPQAEMTLFGGYDDAERQMAGFNAGDFPIAALKISVKAPGLGHRDYLGSVMGLGIEREKTGDIITEADGAVLILHEDVADYVLGSLTSVGRFSASVQRADIKSIAVERKFTEKSGTVASLRLDSLCALMIGKGREAANELVGSGRVFVNGLAVTKADMKLSGGDMITVRGFGRAFLEVGGKSRKDRIFVTLKKQT